MDADMQHDERLLPIQKNEPVDLVVGSRHVAGGGIGEWDAGRAKVSAFAAPLSRIICKAEIADPMRGFFMPRREVLEGALRRLSAQGFEILLDILTSSPGICGRGTALRAPGTAAWRKQTRYASGLGIPDGDRRQADRPHRSGSFRPLSPLSAEWGSPSI
jgi:hypothetical protein